MSFDTDDETQEQHEQIANAFGRTSDPLAQYDQQFKQIDVDPFALYDRENLQARGLVESSYGNHKRVIRQWKDWMDQYERHPACPNEQHVKDFARHELQEKGNQRKTVKEKLQKLSGAYAYFQNEASFPHDVDYNPFLAAMGKMDLSKEEGQDPHPMTIEEVRNVMEDIKHVRDRCLVGCQFKWGVRASELCNIKLSEIHLTNSDLLDHYDEMGTHHALDGRENAVFIPHDRKENKSERPRVIPIDDETRQMLIDYLLIRPDVSEPWLFLSKKSHSKLHKDNLNDVWIDHFQPEFGPNERFRGVTSHYGRHFFTTYFHEQTDMTRSEVKYLRGDKQQGGEIRSTREAIDSYVHVYYEDIESIYRREVFKFRL